MTETITITFCDAAENHVGMQTIGTCHNTGFTFEDLLHIQKHFPQTEMYDLNENSFVPKIIENVPKAYILIIRNAINYADELFSELKKLEWDSKAFMYGQVKNKKARHNLCFGDHDQNHDYENKKGTVVSWERVPLLHTVRHTFDNMLNMESGLVAEGNHYYDVRKCGLGYHGDFERKKVIGLRLGATMPLVYQWYLNSKPVSHRLVFTLNHGDMYVMSEKATGNDWKKKKIYTLRHAAGCSKYTNV